MNFSRRSLLASLAGGLAALSLSFAALPTMADKANTLTIGASAVPHAELLEFITPMLKEQGVNLEIMVFSDYILPNLALDDKEIDANFFQHKPYLDTFNTERGTDLVVPTNGAIHIEPFGAYSRTIKSINDLKDGASVALPNDPTNGARALMLLHKKGFITLKDPNNLLSTPEDLANNAKHLQFVEMEAAQLPHMMDEVDLVLVNTNYALQAGMNPLTDALLIEGKDSPYANIIATRKDNADSENIKKLVNALRSDAVKKFLIEHYKGALVPAF